METSERILREFDTIAVVGASRDPAKPAHSVPLAMQAEGYRIIPLNPHASELFGTRVFRTLREIDRPVEIVLVFRPSKEAEGIVRDAVEIGARAVWLQLDIVSERARSIAEAAGLLYVENRCIAVERSLRGISKRPSIIPGAPL